MVPTPEAGGVAISIPSYGTNSPCEKRQRSELLRGVCRPCIHTAATPSATPDAFVLVAQLRSVLPGLTIVSVMALCAIGLSMVTMQDSNVQELASQVKLFS